MPMCRIVQPSEILSRGLFKDERKNAKKKKKVIYFSPSLSFLLSSISFVPFLQLSVFSFVLPLLIFRHSFT